MVGHVTEGTEHGPPACPPAPGQRPLHLREKEKKQGDGCCWRNRAAATVTAAERAAARPAPLPDPRAVTGPFDGTATPRRETGRRPGRAPSRRGGPRGGGASRGQPMGRPRGRRVLPLSARRAAVSVPVTPAPSEPAPLPLKGEVMPRERPA